MGAQLSDFITDRLHLLDHDVLRSHLGRQVRHTPRQRHYVRFQTLEPFVDALFK